MEQADNTRESMSDSERGAHEAFKALNKAANELIIGQHRLMERLLIALLSNGHLLVEGAPGLAKTTAIKVIADRIDAVHARFQVARNELEIAALRRLAAAESGREQPGRQLVEDEVHRCRVLQMNLAVAVVRRESRDVGRLLIEGPSFVGDSSHGDDADS